MRKKKMITKLQIPNGPTIQLADVSAIKVGNCTDGAHIILVNHDGKNFLSLERLPKFLFEGLLTALKEATNAHHQQRSYTPNWDCFKKMGVTFHK